MSELARISEQPIHADTVDTAEPPTKIHNFNGNSIFRFLEVQNHEDCEANHFVLRSTERYNEEVELAGTIDLTRCD